ncbi:nucleotide sugar dehydrogenase [Thalassococcus sp. S3]|uniref:nucleotide sugar dehydrogenase n=1 Tax=Thalassococcus sp. S3 TaxID=2017482 RepID=UPI00102481C3|nr:nucleotide sugar dehydrogenase [Thalassococcus sp. S3]QBF30830.1 GDP-mannose dehydrogenase [Thalassococcus sp. S3]
MELQRLDTRNAEYVPAPALEKARISVVGLGYVGAVSTACLSRLGHEVIGVDVDREKVDQVGRGVSPIHEKDLSDYLSSGVAQGRITTTDDLAAAVRETDVTFISVGTPTAADGGCDFKYIEQAARSMAVGLRQKSGFHVFAMRCSIPPGTTLDVMAPILERMSGREAGRDFGICFNPEFLREGVAIEDFHCPPKTVIGTTDLRTAEIMKRIYAPVDQAPIITTVEAAEMVKYVDNVWHATKVCFANEIGRLCKPMGIDSHAVMDIFTKDTKLNLSPYYLKPGFAYGGSCLPKEVRAVTHMAEQAGINLPMIGNLDRSNKEHIEEAVRMVRATGAKRVGVLGVAFKPGTDDLRESPVLEVMAQLQADGVTLLGHDCAITQHTAIHAQLAYVQHGNPGLTALAADLPGILSDDLDAVIEGSDVVIVCHANDRYRAALQKAGKQVIDLVRLYSDLPRDGRVNGIGW